MASTIFVSCGSSRSTAYLETFTPEESGLNLVKITDEASNTILAGGGENVSANLVSRYNSDYKTTTVGYSKMAGYKWGATRTLNISPDGKKLAYMTRMNGQDNVMVRGTGAQGMATQRTFRNVVDFTWGPDNKLYFGDYNSGNSYISAVDAEQGSMMNQITNGSVYDMNPATVDGQVVFFTRTGKLGPSIWSINRKDGTLTSCAPGFQPCPIPGNPEAFYCIRNNSGRSEIWYVNYVKGQETLILSDQKRSFTHPSLSPDGKWIVCQGNAVSNINNKNNLDIFVVRTDGTNLTQLTYNPSFDGCPVFAKDGRSIYFISSRANRNESYNIWRMNFNMGE